MKEYSIKKLPSSKEYLYNKQLQKCSKDILKDGHIVKKIFPTIGLPDHKDKKSVEVFIPITKVKSWVIDHLDGGDYYEDDFSRCLSHFAINNSKCDKDNLILTKDLEINVLDKKISLSRGTVVNDILINFIKIQESKIDLGIFKEKLNVVFSSDPIDLFTMSMRGINSCMKWKSAHSGSLIGSVFDPYCAIIYLTNNEDTKYGKKMIARSIVRYTVDHNKKPSIFIEGSYINTMCDSDIDDDTNDTDIQEFCLEEVQKIFVNYIKSKVKIPVIRSEYYINDDLTIPTSPEVKKLFKVKVDDGKGVLSYIDDDALEYDEEWEDNDNEDDADEADEIEN
jgi:hypothetical protein